MNLEGASARERIVRRVLTGLMVSLGAVGLGWVARQSQHSTPSLDEAIGLTAAGRLDDAEAKVRARLVADPGDGDARLLLAQIILKKPQPPSAAADPCFSPSAQMALDQLDRVRVVNPSRAVMFHLCRGDALYRMMRFDEAEAAWLRALDVDPAAPEAGWDLLRLYYIQGRNDEARRLALQLYRVEPDAHDRACLLVELLRPDARPPAPASVVKLFEPIDRHRPGEFQSGLSLGLAQTRANKVEEGIDHLRRMVQTHPDRVEAWDCLLTGLDESGQIDLMQEELVRLPTPLSDSPRLLKHRARVAQAGNRWQDAVDLYRRARTAEPYNRVVEYRLSRALRHTGLTAAALQIEERVRRRDAAILDLRSLYDRASTTPDLGARPHTELIQRIADARERMQLPDEASAWHRLVLEHDPKNEVSLAALVRLGDEGTIDRRLIK